MHSLRIAPGFGHTPLDFFQKLGLLSTWKIWFCWDKMNAERCVQPIILLRVRVICNLSCNNCIANVVSICYESDSVRLAGRCSYCKKGCKSHGHEVI